MPNASRKFARRTTSAERNLETPLAIATLIRVMRTVDLRPGARNAELDQAACAVGYPLSMCARVPVLWWSYWAPPFDVCSKSPGRLIAMQKNRIVELFKAVDDGLWSDLLSFYHPECRYERPGFERLVGLAELSEFYRSSRPIHSGIHTIDTLIGDGDEVCAVGRFDGLMKTGALISLRFADRYRFEGDLIIERTTYFYSPLA